MSIYVENSAFSPSTMADLEMDGSPIPDPPDPPPCSMPSALLWSPHDAVFKPKASVDHEILICQLPGTRQPVHSHVHSALADSHHHGINAQHNQRHCTLYMLPPIPHICLPVACSWNKLPPYWQSPSQLPYPLLWPEPMASTYHIHTSLPLNRLPKTQKKTPYHSHLWLIMVHYPP